MIRRVLARAGTPMPPAPAMQREAVRSTVKAILTITPALAIATVQSAILALTGLLRLLILRLAAAGDE
jgi:hypothetical protein